MLYSRTSKDEKLSFFSNFLEHIINGQSQYVPIVETVIREAYDLANGKKTFYTINREDYPIITFLVEENQPFFKTIDLGHITQADYEDILKMVSKQREVQVSQ